MLQETPLLKALSARFGVEERGSTVPRELAAGAATFASMAYILAVQPAVMSNAGMEAGAVFTATALSAGAATIVMALVGKLPIALASGLGINVYIAFTVCGAMGFTWQTALAAVFVEGVVFLVLSLCGVRQALVKAIPETIKKAAALGIGLLVAIAGLDGAGILHTGGGTPLAVGAVTSGAPLVAVLGLVILIVLYTRGVSGAVLIAILAAAVIGIPLGVTTLPPDFTAFSLPPAPYTPVDVARGLQAASPMDFFVVFFSLLFVDIFDTVATLSGVALQGKLLDEDGNIVNCKQALVSDAVGTILGSLVGATTVTSYLESLTGVASGGRTGLASVATGVLFFLALFFSPLFLLIPAAATAPALIFVGFLMLGAVSNIDVSDVEVGLPIFITMLIIPTSYSISEGLAWGFIVHTLVKAVKRKWREITPAVWALSALFLVKLLFVRM
ncbi:MAG: NCS2 family permease [Spirochaetaceae bacterium]|jgi:AGZA family xanthine/uracil permease-like MFS transporter|nr:NCS2 family permease [Spirochaetaceae bacterium]